MLAGVLAGLAEECNWGPDLASTLLEIYNSLLAHKNHLNEANIRFVCTRFVLNRRAPANLRECAIDFLSEFVEIRRKLCKGELLKVIVESAAEVVAEGLPGWD
jgi:hypothetical protein